MITEEAGSIGAPRRRRPWYVYAILAMLVTLVGTLGALFLVWMLTPVPGGTLRVRSSPEAGDVSLDDGPVIGRTPLELGGLPLGRHEILVEAPGYEPHETVFVIQEPGQLVTVLVPLERTGLERGILEVPGAEGSVLMVDDDAERHGIPARLELPPGEHRVIVIGPGGERYEAQLAIEAGRTTVMAPPPFAASPPEPTSGDVERPEPTRPERAKKGWGYLNLSSTPWAEVYIGGKRLGTTPLIKAKLPAGRLRLKLLPEGRPPARNVSVRIKAGGTTRRTVTAR